MNLTEELKERLKKYSRGQIIFTMHARIRALQRGIDLEEIKDNLLNPIRLSTALKQEAEKENEEKYDCYFAYSRNLCHRYV